MNLSSVLLVNRGGFPVGWDPDDEHCEVDTRSVHFDFLILL